MSTTFSSLALFDLSIDPPRTACLFLEEDYLELKWNYLCGGI